MISREDDGVWIVLQETIACHHDELFACLTTPDGLSRWFPTAARVDLRTGGQVVLSWDKDFTRTTTIAILGYNPEGRITWDWQVAHNDTHAPVYWHVQPSLEEGCVSQMRQGPFNEDVESLVDMAVEVESWRWRLCNLRSVLEVAVDMRSDRSL